MNFRDADIYRYLLEFILLVIGTGLGVFGFRWRNQIKQAKEMEESMRAFEIELEDSEDEYRHIVNRILVCLGKVTKQQKTNGELDKLYEELEAAYTRWKAAKAKRQNKHWEFYIVSNRYGVNRRV